MDRRQLLRAATATAVAGASGITAWGLSRPVWPLWDQPNPGPLGVVFTGVTGATATSHPPAPTLARIASHATVSGELAFVERNLIGPGEKLPRLLPGTRVLASAPGAQALAEATRAFLACEARHRVKAWLADERPPLAPDVVDHALLDVHSLTWALPSPVAGWLPNWRFTWPRDTAHVIALLAQIGHRRWAAQLATSLAVLARDDGTFEARYVPGHNSAPDNRPTQFDGTGWALWAAAAVCEAGGDDGKSSVGDLLNPARSALTRCTRALVRSTGGPGRVTLPAPSPDYWEKPEHDLTLATAASALMGLQAAGTLARAGALTTDAPTAGNLDERARHLAHLITQRFGPTGYQRYPRGGGADAGLLTLLPPYVDHGRLDGVFDAHFGPGLSRAGDRLEQAWRAMRRPAGGVAPAAQWKRDGVSWTPQTAQFAQAFAHCGVTGRARDTLSWLAAHRTPMGALPEKIVASGQTAGPAPLAWPSAVMASTLLTLAREHEGSTP